jgi:hypothetical protein
VTEQLIASEEGINPYIYIHSDPVTEILDPVCCVSYTVTLNGVRNLLDLIRRFERKIIGVCAEN